MHVIPDAKNPPHASLPLLCVRALSVTFMTKSGNTTVVKDVSFEINRGETLALVGESGSGKSVIAHALMQLLKSHSPHHLTGSIVFQGQELLGLPEEKMQRIRGAEISMIFQEPVHALNPLHPIHKQIAETLYLHQHLSKTEARERILELLDLVGITHPQKKMHAYPHELSGGQCQRVMIAIALANHPKLLIADEPTTALDVTIQAQILKLLDKIERRLQTAILLITHNLPIVRYHSDRVCILKQGVIVEHNATYRLFEDPQHADTQALLYATPMCKLAALDTKRDLVLSVHHIQVSFPHLLAVRDVSFCLHRGETIGIVGESGCGKTSLALAILRLIPATGAVYFCGVPLSHLSQKEMRQHRRAIQMVFQNPFGSLNPRLTVAQIVEEGLIYMDSGQDKKERLKRVGAILTEVGLTEDIMHRYPHEFSGGQRQRIALARALILKPMLLVLDEPTSSLDKRMQKQLLDLLLKLQQEHQMAYLFISHDLALIRAMSDEILVMKNGEVVETGLAQDIFSNPKHPYTQQLLRASFE